MKLISVILILAAFASCKKKQDFSVPRVDMYVQFRHIMEIGDPDEPGITKGYQLLDDTITNDERETMISLLQEFNWSYKITTTNEVMINIIPMDNLHLMNYLNSELKKRMISKQEGK